MQERAERVTFAEHVLVDLFSRLRPVRCNFESREFDPNRTRLLPRKTRLCRDFATVLHEKNLGEINADRIMISASRLQLI